MKVLKIDNSVSISSSQRASDLMVFYHHIYEFKKGIRNLILTTENSAYKEHIVSRLNNEKIDFVIQNVNESKINVFFGAKDCVNVVKTFVVKKLNELSAEQDFLLGIMLGYDRLRQCQRYLKLKDKKALKNNMELIKG